MRQERKKEIEKVYKTKRESIQNKKRKYTKQKEKRYKMDRLNQMTKVQIEAFELFKKKNEDYAGLFGLRMQVILSTD